MSIFWNKFQLMVFIKKSEFYNQININDLYVY